MRFAEGWCKALTRCNVLSLIKGIAPATEGAMVGVKMPEIAVVTTAVLMVESCDGI
jgi:hypothetical protein